MAGQYGGAKPMTGDEQEHGYEWEQAREEERMARGQAPPGYDVTGSELIHLSKQGEGG